MTLIADSAELAAFCKRQAKAEYITVDTEFMRDSTFWPKLCLAQLGGPEESVAIDTLAPGMDLAPLLDLMKNTKILKVFHSARQDLEIFFLLMDALPEPIFEIFENVMREESQHIVFFINWFAHHQASQGALGKALRRPKSLWHYVRALWAVASLAGDDDAGEEGADFLVTGAKAFVDDLTPLKVIDACLSENERRMAGFDRRLLVPRLAPTLAGVAGAGLRLLPAG